jgi:microcystin-dependent protein
MKYNKNLAGVQITDELINRATNASARLAHDTILASTVVVRTAPAGGGTLLSLTTDYTLGSEDPRLTTEAGGTVNTTLAVVNNTYFNTALYVTYKTVGDYAEAEDATPSGSILMFAGSTAPDNWLLCDGTAVSRATYNKLFQAIGTTWGAGNGTTTFNLPDMRGAAPAGVGISVGYTQAETIALGTKYNDQIQGHSTRFVSTGGSYIGTSGEVIFRSESSDTTPDASFINIPTGSSVSGVRARGNFQLANDGTNGDPRLGNVSRGKRVGVNFIIKV